MYTFSTRTQPAPHPTMAQQPGPWKKRILVPFWIVRIILMVFIIIIYALTLRYIDEYKDMVKPAVA